MQRIQSGAYLNEEDQGRVVKRHTISEEKETYILKFKDRPIEKNAINIRAKGITIKELRLLKIPKHNNAFILEIMK